MPKYMFKASYGSEGSAGVLSKGGASRRDAIAKSAEHAREAGRAQQTRAVTSRDFGPPCLAPVASRASRTSIASRQPEP